MNVNRGYLHDGRGNLSERQSGSVDDVYGYDAFDRMVTAKQRIPLAALDSQLGLSQTSYRYNALNHRVSKSNLAGVKHFSYDDQAKGYSELRARWQGLPTESGQQLQALLESTGCLRYLRD